MLEYKPTADGFDVFFNGKYLGCIDSSGFYINPHRFVERIALSANKLRELSYKVDELKCGCP